MDIYLRVERRTDPNSGGVLSHGVEIANDIITAMYVGRGTDKLYPLQSTSKVALSYLVNAPHIFITKLVADNMPSNDGVLDELEAARRWLLQLPVVRTPLHAKSARYVTPRSAKDLRFIATLRTHTDVFSLVAETWGGYFFVRLSLLDDRPLLNTTLKGFNNVEQAHKLTVDIMRNLLSKKETN